MRLTVIDKTVRPVKSSHRATRIGERVFMVKVNHYLCTNVGLADVFVHQQACLAARDSGLTTSEEDQQPSHPGGLTADPLTGPIP